MKYLLAVTGLLLAPFAQAQNWNQLLGAAPGQSTRLAASQALDNSADGNIHVQTLSTAGSTATGRLYALNSNGAPLTALTTSALQPANASTVAQAVSARNGYRVSWYDRAYGGGAVQSTFYSYFPGQAVHERVTGVSGQAVFAASDGNGSALVVYEDPQSYQRPRMLLIGGPQFVLWSRMTGGCPLNDFQPARILAADFQPAPVPRLTVVARCEDTPANGGGQIMVRSVDLADGSTLSKRHSWPYADSAAPVIGARAIGQGRFVIEQADSASGEHVARVISIDGEEDPLAMPGQFRLQDTVRFPGGALIPTIDDVRKNLGLLVFDAQRNDWTELPELADLARTPLAWGATAAGSMAVAYRQAQPDQRGPVQLRVLNSAGRVIAKRALAYASQAQGRIELRGLADGSEALLLAADVEQADGSGAVYVEQFVPEGDGTGEIEMPVIDLPRH
ncbi:hypothetical protein [Tahibacter harae]|uniref:Uncharacterized protein n=1 Tax=Tahibacter harae TaxID=2963937 RepID=A0ABT1QUH0_9GAMM|nr:hypothetical protein [Tahibacter harae]MCQ4165934.1 hypothetical protein [Tahibacter harae]